MLVTQALRDWRQRLRSSALWVLAIVLGAVGLLPILSNQHVSAAPTLPEREARVTTSQPGATFDITFEFDLPVGFSSAVQSISIDFCDAPLGVCNNTNTPDITGAAYDSQANWQQNVGFGNLAVSGGNRVELDRTAPAAETDAATDRSITLTGLVNNAQPNTSYYPRIMLYSDTAHTTEVAEGVVAQSTAQQLTVNARVQERLDFCIGVDDQVDDASTEIAADCAALTSNGNGNTIDIGVVDSSMTCISGPANLCDGNNGYHGVAMVRTNAFNGVVIDYFAEQDTGSGRLKVPGATCAGTSALDAGSGVTDQCFNSPATQTAMTTGTEHFGMTIAAVNCGSTQAYACDFSAGQTNLVRSAEYDGSGATTYGTTGGFAWVQDGTTTTLASSAGSAVKVVEDEALILKFGATASVTTPTGQYSVTSTYIATATF